MNKSILTQTKEEMIKTADEKMSMVYEGMPVMTGSIRTMVNKLIERSVDTLAERYVEKVQERIIEYKTHEKDIYTDGLLDGLYVAQEIIKGDSK